MGIVNAHLVVGPDGCVLVDAGLPGCERKVEKALTKVGLTWKDLKLIVITHAHVDHAGSAAALRRLSGAPILAHTAERDYLAGKVPMTLCSTGWAGRAFFKLPLIHERYLSVEPDIQLSGDERFDLAPFGIDGVVRPTPGHTAGSVSVELASGDALVGDLVASGVLLGGIMRTSHAIRPPFEESPVAVGRQLEGLVERGALHFHIGHGGPIDSREVLRHAQALGRLQPGPAGVQRWA